MAANSIPNPADHRSSPPTWLSSRQFQHGSRSIPGRQWLSKKDQSTGAESLWAGSSSTRTVCPWDTADSHSPPMFWRLSSTGSSWRYQILIFNCNLDPTSSSLPPVSSLIGPRFLARILAFSTRTDPSFLPYSRPCRSFFLCSVSPGYSSSLNSSWSRSFVLLAVSAHPWATWPLLRAREDSACHLLQFLRRMVWSQLPKSGISYFLAGTCQRDLLAWRLRGRAHCRRATGSRRCRDATSGYAAPHSLAPSHLLCSLPAFDTLSSPLSLWIRPSMWEAWTSVYLDQSRVCCKLFWNIRGDCTAWTRAQTYCCHSPPTLNHLPPPRGLPHAYCKQYWNRPHQSPCPSSHDVVALVIEYLGFLLTFWRGCPFATNPAPTSHPSSSASPILLKTLGACCLCHWWSQTLSWTYPFSSLAYSETLTIRTASQNPYLYQTTAQIPHMLAPHPSPNHWWLLLALWLCFSRRRDPSADCTSSCVVSAAAGNPAAPPAGTDSAQIDS